MKRDVRLWGMRFVGAVIGCIGIVFLISGISVKDLSAQTKGIGVKVKARDGREITVYTQIHALLVWASAYRAGGWSRLESVPG